MNLSSPLSSSSNLLNCKSLVRKSVNLILQYYHLRSAKNVPVHICNQPHQSSYSSILLNSNPATYGGLYLLNLSIVWKFNLSFWWSVPPIKTLPDVHLTFQINQDWMLSFHLLGRTSLVLLCDYNIALGPHFVNTILYLFLNCLYTSIYSDNLLTYQSNKTS